jgi:6-phosphogluconate dehydrogenase
MNATVQAIGIVGLGKMGMGIARRLRSHGFRVTGFDREDAARSGAAESGIAIAESIKEVVAALDTPCTIWLMVPAGSATEEAVDEAAAVLSGGDILIDGGNSNYRESRQRAQVLAADRIHMLDVGTSGGVGGEERGYCLMVGGASEAVGRVAPVFDALASDGQAGWRHVGPSGAGHFVKMIHNGIEYGMMQALAEGFALLDAKAELDLDLAEVSELWRHGSIVSSRLLDHVTEALSADADLSNVSAFVADSGEGRWTVQEAVDLAVPAPVITIALLQRFRSRMDDSFADRLLSAMRLGFGGHQPKLL